MLVTLCAIEKQIIFTGSKRGFFLEAYYSKETSYLPPELRSQLHTIGAPPDGARPAGTFARDIMNRLLIDLSWSSSRLEGNTYSRLDTERLIEFVQAAEGKDALETQMILNHKAAIELLAHFYRCARTCLYRYNAGVYEQNRIELLRDVFVWAYERSCQKYLAGCRELIPPDTFRLRYRLTLSDTIKKIIFQLQVPTKKNSYGSYFFVRSPREPRQICRADFGRI